MLGQPEINSALSPRRLCPDHGQPGSYRFVGRISTDKNALVLTDQANFREVGYTEAITELFVWASELSRPDHAQREKLSLDTLE